LIVAILVRGSREATGTWQRSPGQAIALSVALIAALVSGLTWAIVVAGDHTLPWIYVYRVPGHNGLELLLPVVALDVIALVLLWVRGRSVLDLWLMVMCGSWLFKQVLSGILSGSRYTLGWYSGRFFELPATFIVLMLFLFETTALYANLARASIQRRGARHARQIAMDAMAASLGHEIRQPLTAIITNASAGLRQVNEAEEAHATFSDIAADGQRIRAIVSGVRTMFKESTHDRQPLDVNKVVRDALAAVELDLVLQRVIVKADLDGDLPPVLADSGQLHQVFLNLVTNALEAMNGVSGRPSVLRITSGIASSDIAVTVEDTGVGIADKDKARVLEPFFSTKVAGTGIGLTICNVILQAHGGSLQVSANEPYGTIVRVALPIGDDD
jgi:signal transduction histidine kinase